MSAPVLDAARKLLRQLGILRERAPDLVSFWSRAEQVTVPAGTALIHEGKPGDALLFVVDGSVSVSIRREDGTSLTVARLPAPLILGATGAVDGGLRTSTCTVDAPTTVLRMRRGVFADAARQVSPGAELMRELLLINMHRQLAAATRRLQDVM